MVTFGKTRSLFFLAGDDGVYFACLIEKAKPGVNQGRKATGPKIVLRIAGLLRASRLFLSVLVKEIGDEEIIVGIV